MKKKILIFIIGFFVLFSTSAYASEEKLGADLYHFESIEDLGFSDKKEDFDALDSTEKRRLALTLQSYAYSHKKEKRGREVFDLGKTNKVLLDEGEIFLIDFDKTGKTSNPLVIFSKGENILEIKDEDDKDSEKPNNPDKPGNPDKPDGSEDPDDQDPGKEDPDESEDPNKPDYGEKPDHEKSKSINIVFEPGNVDFTGPVRVGVFNSKGNLIKEVILDKDHAYRIRVEGLDVDQKYSVWPLNLDDYYFTIDRIGDTFYIRLTGKKTGGKKDEENGEEKGLGIHQDPQDLDKNSQDGKGASGGSGKKSESQEKKLPQTGLLWLPVPFLFGFGLVFLVLGGKKDEKKNI